MQLLDKDIINKAFSLLGLKLEKNKIIARICVYGGSALLFISTIKRMSADIDYRIIELKSINSEFSEYSSLINKFRKILLEIKEELNLPEDWMNDGVKGFISTDEILSDEITFGDGSLTVIFPSLEYILAMKCIAMRSVDESVHDKNDIKLLIKELNIKDHNKVFDIVQKFYPEKFILPKTSLGILEILQEIENENNRSNKNATNFPSFSPQ